MTLVLLSPECLIVEKAVRLMSSAERMITNEKKTSRAKLLWVARRGQIPMFIVSLVEAMGNYETIDQIKKKI